MKIITFQGGLGNQLFEYAFYRHLKRKYPNESIYSFFPKAALKNHNGLEINKRFRIELPPVSLTSNVVGYFLFYLNKALSIMRLPLLLTSSDKCVNDDTLFFCGYWQDKRYLKHSLELDFNLDKISEKNRTMAEQMKSEYSVCMHIRRGDYLLKDVGKNNYGNICTDLYYARAIEYINTKVDNPVFYIFSDDSDYARSNYNAPNMHVVDWNKGEDSFMDMYLMSCCRKMILANSTFSYWAAILNKSADMVLCPNRWNNMENAPDLIQPDWVIIPS